MGSIPGLGRSPGVGNGTLVFLPGKFHGQRRLEGYSPWSCKESDVTEHASTHTHTHIHTHPHYDGILFISALTTGVCSVSFFIALTYFNNLFLFWNTFLFLTLYPGSSCIFPVPVLDSVTCPRSSNFFYWRMVLETKIWALGKFIATWVLLLPGSP